MKRVNVIGAGLAGVEASWYLANKGFEVFLYEQRPNNTTPAHKTNNFAELVCSNSLRSNDENTAPGLLKKELKMLNSLIIEAAEKFSVPAGSSLAVDREMFSQYITEKIKNHPKITVINQEIIEIPTEPTIIATGPLTSGKFKKAIEEFLGEEYFYFFDAAAPIIEFDSINMEKAYFKSRYDKGGNDYINCPMTEEEFNKFYDELIKAKCVEPKDFELKVFEGCMPFEVMAKRGRQTLLYGPMKPVGLEHNGVKPYAVVQLRQDNIAKSLYNIVGFQTHLTFGEQKRIIQMIPGLENANILRYGVMHRNSFINSPKVLKQTYQSIKRDDLFFAGQITGVEGYIESASSGLVCGINMARLLSNQNLLEFPQTTATGALPFYITHACEKNFQPMNINFGIIKDFEYRVKKSEKKEKYSKRAQEELLNFINQNEIN